MINVALVGTWHVHFNGYAKEIQNNPDCKITALWDNDITKGKEKAEEFGCEFVADYDELLKRDDVDAIMVCTSTDLHHEVIKKAAEAKKHIFTEKVLCFTEADALDVAKAVKENGIKFLISFPWRGRGDFIWVKDAVDSGLIGQVNYCRMRNAHNGTLAGWLPETFYDPKTCGGGAMMDLGAHSMYILNWLLGEPEKASSAFTNVVVKTVEDNAVTVLTYKNGAIGVSETGFVAPNNPFELEIVGDKGTILAGGFLNKLCYNVGDGWIFPNTPKDKDRPIDLWVQSIVNNTPTPYGIHDAVALSKTMEMAYKNPLV
ncbi:MAG: Gfo/Idh/MocA family oxidoreductase [Clostridia bacterium]|nr:Gfo/Idh/MocA family oxidoreductase [Clostridia bacterium]